MLQMKKIMAGVLAIGVMAPAFASAQATTTPSIQTLLDQIKSLQTQIVALQTQQQSTLAQLVAQLKQGSRGDQVMVLQQMLAMDPALYPEGKVTGFYGKLTADAVKRFQKKHGISQAGTVGPKTLKKLNEIFGKIKKETRNHQDDDNDGDDDTASTTPGVGKVIVCHKPGKSNQTLHISSRALSAHINHGDTMGMCSGTGNGGNGTTTPDTTAPVISAITATGIAHTGATIQWTTNEAATTQLAYGTSTAYGATTTLNASLLTSHSVVLSGLTASTLYNYRVVSVDAAGNTTYSGNNTFTTSATPDTTAPTISALSVGSIASTSASVTWTTSEAANSKVYYSTTTPVNMGTALTVSNASFMTSQSLGLTGLSASTTYYLIVESKDAANNTATSSQISFNTSN